MKFKSQIYNGYKLCNKCECMLPIIMFSKSSESRSGLRYQCKDCENQYYKDYFAKNKDKVLRRKKQWREKYGNN